MSSDSLRRRPGRADLDHYKESAGFRLRFAFWRVAAVAGVVYLASVAFNGYDLARGAASDSVYGLGDTLKFLLVDSFTAFGDQIGSLLGSLVAVTVVVLFLLATAPLRYSLNRRSYAKRLALFRKLDNEELRQAWPDVQIDDEVDVPAFVEARLKDNAQRRSDSIDEIRSWFERDELLVDRVALEVAKRRVTKDLFNTVVVSAGAVIVASRLIDVLG